MEHSRLQFKKMGYKAKAVQLPFGKYIEYNKEINNSINCISFLNKTINCRVYDKKIEFPPSPMVVTPEEIKAIYFKCLEMGWIENENDYIRR